MGFFTCRHGIISMNNSSLCNCRLALQLTSTIDRMQKQSKAAHIISMRFALPFHSRGCRLSAANADDARCWCRHLNSLVKPPENATWGPWTGATYVKRAGRSFPPLTSSIDPMQRKRRMVVVAVVVVIPNILSEHFLLSLAFLCAAASDFAIASREHLSLSMHNLLVYLAADYSASMPICMIVICIYIYMRLQFHLPWR